MGFTATIDFTYPVKHELSKVVGDFVENKLFSDFRDKLISIKEQGLEGDMNLRLEENEQSLLDLGKAKKYLESMGFRTYDSTRRKPGHFRATRLPSGR